MTEMLLAAESQQTKTRVVSFKMMDIPLYETKVTM